MNKPVYHIPALLQESVDGLAIKPDGVYVDVTFGGGGHSREIISRLGPHGRLIAMDQDIDAYANRIDDRRFAFAHGNFAFLKNFVRYYGHNQVDGILADLGVSFHHFDDEQRGFSFRADATLDMRMNRSATTDAQQVIAEYSEQQLADVLYLYGELRQSRRIAAAIWAARTREPITTTGQLVSVVEPLLKRGREKKELAQVFQALRIEVNNEIDVLKRFLQGAIQVLKPGGRLVVITYHSLEDRLVKNFMRSGNVEGHIEKDFYGRIASPLRVVNSKIIVPDNDEIERNPRSRSAKLRVAEKMPHNDQS